MFYPEIFLFNILERRKTMQTEILKIAGMTCGGCTSKVALALEAITGVNEVKVSLSDGKAAVKYDEGMTSYEQLKVVVREAGYSVDGAGAAQKRQGKGGCCS